MAHMNINSYFIEYKIVHVVQTFTQRKKIENKKAYKDIQ